MRYKAHRMTRAILRGISRGTVSLVEVKSTESSGLKLEVRVMRELVKARASWRSFKREIAS
jgi:hypothetical protein